jgi:hypothetical protein
VFDNFPVFTPCSVAKRFKLISKKVSYGAYKMAFIFMVFGVRFDIGFNKLQQTPVPAWSPARIR